MPTHTKVQYRRRQENLTSASSHKHSRYGVWHRHRAALRKLIICRIPVCDSSFNASAPYDCKLLEHTRRFPGHMPSGSQRIQSATLSAHDPRQIPLTVPIQSSFRPAHSFGHHSFLGGFHRRAWSAPPGLSAKGSRKGRSGICQELGDKAETLAIKNSATLEKSFPCTHFYHPDFEVVARNIPAPRVQELKRILETFAASLGSRRASYSGSDFRTHDGHDMVLNESPKHVFATLDDPKSTNTTCLGHSFAPPRSCLLQAKYHTFMENADSMSCTCLHGEALDEVSSQLAASPDLMLSPDDPHCNTICYRQSSQRDIDDSHSDSSVDFLYLARKKDPDFIRELEEEYDDMMNQVERASEYSRI